MTLRKATQDFSTHIHRHATRMDFDQLAKLTDRNNHIEAYILGAEMLDLRHLAKKLELVKGLQRLEKGLPHSLSQYRYSLYETLMSAAKQKLSPEDFKQFYGSF